MTALLARGANPDAVNDYGVTPLDDESRRPFLSGYAVREVSRRTSNWRAEEGLEPWLAHRPPTPRPIPFTRGSSSVRAPAGQEAVPRRAPVWDWPVTSE